MQQMAIDWISLVNRQNCKNKYCSRHGYHRLVLSSSKYDQLAIFVLWTTAVWNLLLLQFKPEDMAYTMLHPNANKLPPGWIISAFSIPTSQLNWFLIPMVWTKVTLAFAQSNWENRIDYHLLHLQTFTNIYKSIYKQIYKSNGFRNLQKYLQIFLIGRDCYKSCLLVSCSHAPSFNLWVASSNPNSIHSKFGSYGYSGKGVMRLLWPKPSLSTPPSPSGLPL